MQPKVTIVIPVYNGGDYFELALKSALAQTYKNIEIIVVNDGSTDGGKTDAIAKKYLPWIKYIHQTNKGVASALNAAIRAMTGDFFAWLSHDDLFLPEKITAQVEFHRKLGKRDAILFGDYELIDATGKTITHVRLDHKKFMQFPMLPLLNGSINGCTLFIPIHLLREYGPFDETLRHTQDYDLWNKILSHHEFFHQPATLIRYRIHPEQGTHSPDAAVEGDPLWIRMLDARSEAQCVQLFGSTKKFFSSMADFLSSTPYKEAAKYARARALSVVSETMVSVVIPFYNEVDELLRAAESVLRQTHRNVELILVDDGSTSDIGRVQALAKSDSRICLIRQQNAGPGAARNRGMDVAVGEYIAFLDADDLFAPHKIQLQLAAMEDTGSLMSHTSYFVRFPERHAVLGRQDSGRFTGRVYPNILQNCPISTPTVMLHRSLLSAGFLFSTESYLCEDILSWIWIAQRHAVLGIDEPLSIIEWTSDSAAINFTKGIRGHAFLLQQLCADPIHSRYPAELAVLGGAITDLFRLEQTQALRFSGQGQSLVNEDHVATIFPS